jgi:hypothetical protein
MTHYRVRVKKGDAEVEVDSSDKDYTETKLKELLVDLPAREPAGPPTKPAGKQVSATAAPGKPLSMVEYVRSLAPKSGAQYVVAIGNYLEKHGGMASGFKTRDIVEGFTTTKYKHSNPAEAVRQAKTQGLLMDGKEAGSLLVTSTGEDWVKVQLGVPSEGSV